MSKTIYIGGRLESKEKGNVVTGANAILDDTKGKKQNVINKETDDELLRLEQSKQDNLTFDNAPTEDSTNPVTSGGVYTAEKALSDAIEAILLLIPSAATALNKLVDTNTMNSSISTATATFRGTYNAVSDLGLTYQATHAQIEAALDALGLTADNNDFAFVQIPVSDQSQDIAKTERFKFNGTNWLYEYDLNTSGFTAAQWAAINSGITVALVTKLTDLPTAAALQLALNAKQDTLTFDNEPTALSQNPVTSGGIYTAIQAVATALSNYSTTTDGRLNTLEGLVPAEASSSNKLTDKAYVDGLIQAITELIPAEADTTNQLADKAYVLAQILAATPAFKGQYTTLAELQAVASPKDGDLGIVRTKDSDGMDVFTVYQYLSNAWNVFYSLSYHPQTKPATTGTTGDYPYNGMGRVELAKNMVNTGTDLDPVMVNQLTQDMFNKGAVGSRVPNINTIFVIRYDYVLGENITIPDGCVLQFEGGSISGAYIITGNNTKIISDETPIFKNGVIIAGTWICPTITSNWFADITSTNRLVQLINLTNASVNNTIFINSGTYSLVFSASGDDHTGLILNSNTNIVLNGTIEINSNNRDDYQVIYISNCKNIKISGSGKIKGDVDNSSSNSEHGHLIFTIGEVSNITIEGITFEKSLGDGIYLYGITNNVEISHCVFNYCGRDGISTTAGTNIYIHDNIFNNINNKMPKAAIEIETDHAELGSFIRNIVIENNECIECFSGLTVSANGADINRVIYRNNHVVCSMSRHFPVLINSASGHTIYDVIVENNRIECFDEGLNLMGIIGCSVRTNNIRKSLEGQTGTMPMLRVWDCNNAIIEGNYIECISAVVLNNSNGVKLSHNTIKSDNGTAIIVESGENNYLISYNTLVGGIQLKGNNGDFVRNKLTCGALSCWIGNSSGETRNIKISDNYFDLGDSAERRAIYCYGSLKDSLIRRNTSNDSDGYARVDFATGSGTNLAEGLRTKGDTVDRPSYYNIQNKGSKFYDISINKELCWNGSDWVNTDGSQIQ